MSARLLLSSAFVGPRHPDAEELHASNHAPGSRPRPRGPGDPAAPSFQRRGALPLISEVFYDAVGADDGLSFVEISGAPGTDLAGYSLEGVNGSNGSVGPVLALSGTIPADGLFVVADDLGGGASSVPRADLILNFDFQNGRQTRANSRR